MTLRVMRTGLRILWNTTGNEITGLWVHWDAGGESNSVTWRYTWTLL
ncbi:MAG: hypothetical protein IPP40_17290 [bacterium]|nr:hypothetical protein [bacterium]